MPGKGSPLSRFKVENGILCGPKLKESENLVSGRFQRSGTPDVVLAAFFDFEHFEHSSFFLSLKKVAVTGVTDSCDGSRPSSGKSSGARHLSSNPTSRNFRHVLLASNRFQSWAIRDHERATLQRHKLLVLEFTERGRRRFP
jgi:hypothetical protein